MSSVITWVPDVFSAHEIARVAGVSPADVQGLLDGGAISSRDGFVAPNEAVRAVRMLRGELTAPREPELFRPPAPAIRSRGRALAASGALHTAVLAALVLLTTMGLASAPQEITRTPARLVFLATPGPGGGGGGGGLRQPAPPPRAEMKGAQRLRSPVPPPRPVTRRPDPKPKVVPPPPVRPQPVARPVEPPPPIVQPTPMPQVVAPVATVAADTRDRAGVVEAPAAADSNGPGTGGGAGTGQGTGMGEGTGSGIGPGSGGGTGGGPYRPGSGITAPSVLREVKPDYTEEARRRGVEGDVVLEIVVRADGSVGDVKVLQGLGNGLDQRAADAVRQWRFSPARRYGTPVDVMVEVAVEFKLR